MTDADGKTLHGLVTFSVVFLTGGLVGLFAGRWMGEQERPAVAQHAATPQITEVRCRPVPSDDDGACSLHMQRTAMENCFSQCSNMHREMIGWDVSRDGAQCRCAPVEIHYGGP